MDFNVCKNSEFKYPAKGTSDGSITIFDIPTAPAVQKFLIESFEQTLEIWVDDATAPGNTKWVFKYKPTSPQSVNVTIGGDE